MDVNTTLQGQDGRCLVCFSLKFGDSRCGHDRGSSLSVVIPIPVQGRDRWRKRYRCMINTKTLSNFATIDHEQLSQSDPLLLLEPPISKIVSLYKSQSRESSPLRLPQSVGSRTEKKHVMSSDLLETSSAPCDVSLTSRVRHGERTSLSRSRGMISFHLGVSTVSFRYIEH